MTINELTNVHHANIDKATGEELTHSEQWGRVINALGYEDVKRCIPFTLSEIKNALQHDEYLNNLSMSTWDAAGGWRAHTTRNGQTYYQTASPLTGLLRKAGVTSFSPSDSVCILKEAARLWAEE